MVIYRNYTTTTTLLHYFYHLRYLFLKTTYKLVYLTLSNIKISIFNHRKKRWFVEVFLFELPSPIYLSTYMSLNIFS